jgi:hypothetical protein
MDRHSESAGERERLAAMLSRLRAGGTVRRTRTNSAKDRASERVAETGREAV